MSKKLARRNVDLANLPPLTEAQEAQLAALEALPDDKIDVNDIPSAPEEFWKDAARGRFYSRSKPRRPSGSTPVSWLG